ncbi:MAG: HAD-IC family P-type ATPase, partial [Clostridia bacterium]|nr:HAD-IC family P-type ATPase [Clostridia bacterium]
MLPHSTSGQQLLNQLQTDEKTGLTASQAAEKLQEFGANRFAEAKKKTMLQRFFDQFRDAMIIILLVAAAVSFGIACYEGNPKEFFEPALIILIVVLNAIMGVLQESKAEKALDALKSMSVPHARVIRDGKETVIDAADLVPGDIIRLEAGDMVPADARLLKSVSLKSEESALTGESIPSEKDAEACVSEDAPLGDRVNMVFSGCSIAYGTATAVVCATGMNTEMGNIASLLNESENVQTPLQKKLAQLGKYLGFIALAACAVIFAVGLMEGVPVLDMFMTSVSLAVSAIPEGLPAIVTIVLSIGVQRMVKKNAIIRRLPAVETLGSASVICSDKTGTLTQNRMTLVQAYSDVNKESETITTKNTDEIRRILTYGTLCSDGSVMVEGETVKHIGDPTETSIVYAAYQNGISKEALQETCPRLGEIPFDSDRKLMTSVNRIDGEIVVIVKGAFDVLSSRCIGGDVEVSTAVNEDMSSSALRVIGVAYKILENVPQTFTSEELENGLTFLGLVGMIDPPRAEAKDAVAVCKQAGIKPVMITGDHVVTASAIAKELGILSEGERAVSGTELDEMTEEELDQNIENISVYARVSPENKIR